MLVYQSDGMTPMDPMAFAKGLVINICAVLVACILLRLGGVSGFVGRFVFCLLLGVFLGLAMDLIQWNWMHFPTDYTLVNIADHAVSWALIGLVAGVVMKAPRAAAPE